jgi:hypothetical protein
MTHITKIMCGVILLTVPTIQYGGYFLLQLLSGKHAKMQLTDFQRSMFRAGHAHAGVLVILSLVAEILVDSADLSGVMEWVVRIGFPLAAILVSGGFFAAAAGKGLSAPNKMIAILYVGVVALAVSLIILGIGLIAGK